MADVISYRHYKPLIRKEQVEYLDPLFFLMCGAFNWRYKFRNRIIIDTPVSPGTELDRAMLKLVRPAFSNN